jgi:hypothetical protein
MNAKTVPADRRCMSETNFGSPGGGICILSAQYQLHTRTRAIHASVQVPRTGFVRLTGSLTKQGEKCRIGHRFELSPACGPQTMGDPIDAHACDAAAK